MCLCVNGCMCVHVSECVRVCARACTHKHTHTHTHTSPCALFLLYKTPSQRSLGHAFHDACNMRSMTPATRLQTDSRTFVAMRLQYERPRGFQKTPSEAPPRYAFETKEMRVAWQEGRELRTRGMSLHLPLCLARVLGRACAHVRETDNRSTGCQQ